MLVKIIVNICYRMGIFHVALEMYQKKQLKNIYKIKDKAYICYLKRIAVLRPNL